ncbi:hypothetical protein SprV_0401700000 [Sparganum proliferum]
MWRLRLSFPHTNFTQLVALPDHEKLAITMQGEPFSRTKLYQTFSFLDSKPFYHITDAKKSIRTVRCAIKVPGDPLALKATTIIAADEDIQEDQLVVFFLLHLKWNVREDGVELFFEFQHLIPFDDDEGVIHIPSPEFRSVVSENQRLQLLQDRLDYESPYLRLFQ